MPAIVRPKQQILFSDRPRGLVQADLLDAQIHNLIEAIHSTQLALEDIRRDDGKLKSNSVGREQLQTELKHSRQEIDSVEQRATTAADNSAQAAAKTISLARDIDLRARDAEAAAVSAAKMLSAISHGNINALDSASDAENAADRAESAAIDAKNDANYSHAQADNAIAAKNEATQWAEYLAGPVVNPEMAPAYIQNHPFGHGLYYQPVEGGLAGL
jgi:DNA repair exonuclease SbcCD ATPase subunit